MEDKILAIIEFATPVLRHSAIIIDWNKCESCRFLIKDQENLYNEWWLTSVCRCGLDTCESINGWL